MAAGITDGDAAEPQHMLVSCKHTRTACQVKVRHLPGHAEDKCGCCLCRRSHEEHILAHVQSRGECD